MDSQYTLSQQIQGHEKGNIRSMDFFGNYLLTGSNDKTIKLYIFENNQYIQVRIWKIGDFALKVRIRRFGQGFLVCCKDKNVYLFNMDNEDVVKLQGHTGPVNSVSEIDQSTIVTGGWDGVFIIFDMISFQPKKIVEGFKHATTVCANQNQIIAGSQDKQLKFYTLSGEFIKTVNEAHDDIIRDIVEYQGVIFTSSNDGFIKVWSIDGELISQLSGHQAFVYSIYCIEINLQVSASEDRCIIIWENMEKFQSILHPSTVWTVTYNPQNGDILSGSEDGVIRVFTKDFQRKADDSIIQQFNEFSILNQAKNPETQFSADELSKFPEFNPDLQGKQDEVKVFKTNGIPQVYSYQNGIWQLIGEAVGPNNFYEGDRYFPSGIYDNIFKVDLGGGGEKSLPFNNGDNPMAAAETFIAREGISKSNIEQIRQFLMQQTKGKTIQKKEPKFQQPIKQNTNQTYRFFPIKQPLFFEGINQEMVLKKINESNSELQRQNDPVQLVLREQEYVQNIVKELSNPYNKFPNIQFSKFELQVIGEKLFKWPQSYQLPVFDILRVFMLHYQSESIFSTLENGNQFILNICSIVENQQTSEPQKALYIKLLCNCFNHTSNIQSVLKNQQLILNTICRFQNTQNSTLRNAIITLIFNYVTQSLESCQQIVEIVQNIIKIEQQPQNLIKLFATLGTLVLNKNIKFDRSILDLSFNSDQNVEECIQDIKTI